MEEQSSLVPMVLREYDPHLARIIINDDFLSISRKLVGYLK